jgi:hypothetical protein
MEGGSPSPAPAPALAPPTSATSTDPERALGLFLAMVTWLAVTAAMWTARLRMEWGQTPQKQPLVPSAAGRIGFSISAARGELQVAWTDA